MIAPSYMYTTTNHINFFLTKRFFVGLSKIKLLLSAIIFWQVATRTCLIILTEYS
ncbi:hypothetical protein ACJX0J_010032, partial [Zea mays]